MRVFQRKTKGGKGDPKTIKNSKHKDQEGIGEIEVSPDVQEFESLEEAEQSAGGREGLLKFVNRAYLSEQIAAVRNYVGGENATLEGIKSRLLEIPTQLTLTAILQGSSRASTREKAEQFDTLASLIAAGKQEEALALLMKAAANK